MASLPAIRRMSPVLLLVLAFASLSLVRDAAAQEEGPSLGQCIPEYALQHSFWLNMGNQVGGYSHGPQGGSCDQNHPVYSPS